MGSGMLTYLANSREEVVGDLVVQRPRQKRDELAVVGVVDARLDLRVRQAQRAQPAQHATRYTQGLRRQQHYKEAEPKTDPPTGFNIGGVPG